MIGSKSEILVFVMKFPSMSPLHGELIPLRWKSPPEANSRLVRDSGTNATVDTKNLAPLLTGPTLAILLGFQPSSSNNIDKTPVYTAENRQSLDVKSLRQLRNAKRKAKEH